MTYKKLFLRVSAASLVIILAMGIIWYALQLQKQEKSDLKKKAVIQLALLTTGRSTNVYNLASTGMSTSITRGDFNQKFSALSSEKPEFLPGKLVSKKGKYYYYQRVENLPKIASGRTNVDFALEYVNEKGWKLNAVTIE